MPSRRPEARLAPYARLPRTYRDLHIRHSTIDVYGRAHWLLTQHPVDSRRRDPYDAVVVTVEDGSAYATELSAVLPGCRLLEALPDGGFVLAAGRSARDEEHVQVFDALGRSTWTFRVGDGISHFLADEAGDLWVGYFDEGIYGGDELSVPGLRRWSSTGEPLWAFRRLPEMDDGIDDCYALNVSGRVAWACHYPRFPLLEIHADQRVRVWRNPVRSPSALAVHGDRVVFLNHLLVDCRLTDGTVEVVAEGPLRRADGGALGRRRVVSRGPRLYVQEKPFTDWAVYDIG
ncbi:hypothetical protein [Streptomyces sp. NPDC014995]|uniref:hypothetical protein n=1 Tax=Streptomyces sp. NPDC014995 TaxID=3364936 RepID=UPI0037009E31